MRVAALISGLIIASSAWADIGSVTEASGTAVIKRGKDTIQIVKGTEVKTNDKVETKNGKVKMNKAFRRHILNKKTTKRKRHLRKQAYCSKANAAVIKKLIPYK